MSGRAGGTASGGETPAPVSVINLSEAGASAALRRADRTARVVGLVLVGATSARRRLTLEGWSGKPVVAVLSGRVDAPTLALACRADARVAAEDTTLDPGDLAGPTLFPALAELIGSARLPELLVGPELTARRLHELGLVTEVVAVDTTRERAEQLARRLAALGRDALAVLRNRAAPARSYPEQVSEPVASERAPEQPDLRVVPGSRSGPQTRQRILDAAAEVMRTQGYTACRLADIAKLVGTHQTSIYHYFPSKEALVDEVLRVGVTRTFDVVRHGVESLPGTPSPLDRLAAAMRAHLRVVLASGDYATVAMSVTGELPQESLRRVRDIQHRYGQYWRQLFADARDAGYLRPGTNLSVVRAFVAGALNYAIAWYDPALGAVDALADDFIAMVLSGLAEPDRLTGVDPTAIGRLATEHTDLTKTGEI